jgi:hypothetical protein
MDFADISYQKPNITLVVIDGDNRKSHKITDTIYCGQ